MSALSIEFLGIIVALFAANWLLPIRYRTWLLSISGLVALALTDQNSALLLLISATASWFAATKSKGRYTTYTIMGLLALLLIYKVLQALESADQTDKLVLIGFSYYMLRLVHYLVESLKQTLSRHTAMEFAAYVFFLPTLLVGPIHRFNEFIRDEQRRRWDDTLFITGLERIIFGYARIIILANYLVSEKLTAVAHSAGGDDTALGAWLLCLTAAANLYFQFGGYSDIAIGFAMLLGFKVMENFNYPFLARNISDFWARWHMSLSSWCRDYIFSPVSYHYRKPALGALATMLVIGMWHGATWRYVVWGIVHGLAIIVWQRWQPIKARMPWLKRLPPWFRTSIAMLFTFNFVVISFGVTRSADLQHSLDILLTLLGGPYVSIPE